MLLTILLSCGSKPDLSGITRAPAASWTGPEPAVVVDRSGSAPVGVAGTSTAAVRYKDGGVERIRMFGMGSDKFRNHELDFDMPGPPQCGPGSRSAAYMELLSSPTTEFRYQEKGANPCSKTCVPSLEDSFGQKIRVRTTHEPPRDETKTVEMRTIYRDPAVVYVPDLGWLMLLTRTRVSADIQGSQNPGNSLGDVVGFLSPSGSFDREVTGPVLLVDDLEAYPNQTFRAWLGVPSAEYVETGTEASLLIYYATSTPEEPVVDGKDKRPTQADRSPGTAAKRIPLTGLTRAFSGRTPEGKAAPGQLLGHVNIWVATGGTAAAPEVVPHDSLYDFTAQPVDPHPLDCEHGLQLFFTNLPFNEPPNARDADDGVGIWHASGIDQGVQLQTPSGTHTARAGADFVVRAPDGGLSPDQLVPSPGASADTPGRVYIDADPVRMSDGSFTVYTGTWDRASLMRFEGPSELGCRSWKDAFSP